MNVYLHYRSYINTVDLLDSIFFITSINSVYEFNIKKERWITWKCYRNIKYLMEYLNENIYS
jgi:hypothetical protein